MTKELEKEAEEKSNKYYGDDAFTQAHMPQYIEPIRRAYKDGYLAGAEPREKRIEELEQKLEQTEKDLADYQFNYPTIKELEKENETLAQQVKDLRKDLEENKSDCALCYSKDKEQLEQAKEIIKKLYEDCYSIADVEDTNLGFWKDDLSQAKQFLREIDITNAIQKANEGLNLDKIADEVEQDIKEQNEVTIASVWEKHDEVPLKLKVSEVYNEGCPDTLCEDCTKDCPIEKIKEIKNDNYKLD